MFEKMLEFKTVQRESERIKCGRQENPTKKGLDKVQFNTLVCTFKQSLAIYGECRKLL